jgi:hypothetical protein
MFGIEITNDAKERIMAFFQNPCEATWDDIHSIYITENGKTIWNCWIDLDYNAPRSAKLKDDYTFEWERIPNVFTVYRIIKDFGGK